MEGTFEYVTVTPGSEAFADAERINQEAFPSVDRKSMETLVGVESIFPGSKVTAVYEEGKCVSFFHLIEQERFVYGAFFAVAAEKRGQGYGTKILKAMLDHCNGKPFMGEVEYPTEEAENYKQRVARIRFYERNGVHNTGEIVESQGHEKYYVISSAENPPFDAYREFIAQAAEVLHIHG